MRDPIVDVTEHLRENDEQAALERLLDAFGSECDATAPDFHEVDTGGRVSACHRHEPEYDGVAETLRQRFDDRTIR